MHASPSPPRLSGPFFPPTAEDEEGHLQHLPIVNGSSRVFDTTPHPSVVPQEGQRRRHGAQRGAFGAPAEAEFPGFPQDEGEEPSEEANVRTSPNPFQVRKGGPTSTATTTTLPNRVSFGRTAPAAETLPRASRDDMFAILINIVQQLTNQQPAPASAPIPYVYHGRIEEDPAWFLRRVEENIFKNPGTDDVQRMTVVGNQLRGEARVWYDNYVDFASSYQEFRAAFATRFDSPGEWAKARARLYGSHQRVDETVESFLLFKKKLFRRIEPHTSAAIVIQQLTDQLKPSIRSRLRGVSLNNVEEFIRIAIAVEQDEAAERRQTQARTVNSGPPKPKEPTNVREGERAGPPSPCRFCDGWHFHRDCPNNNNSLNGPRVAGRGAASLEQPIIN